MPEGARPSRATARRLAARELGQLLRWAAGVAKRGDRCPEPVFDITRDELDEVVSAARGRVLRGAVRLPVDAPAPGEAPTLVGSDYRPPAWLADIFGGEP